MIGRERANRALIGCDSQLNATRWRALPSTTAHTMPPQAIGKHDTVPWYGVLSKSNVDMSSVRPSDRVVLSPEVENEARSVWVQE